METLDWLEILDHKEIKDKLVQSDLLDLLVFKGIPDQLDPLDHKDHLEILDQMVSKEIRDL
jgi:hypothetical protein